MRLRNLRDVYRGQDIYIIGSGPTLNLFPLDLLRDKICMSLNDAYKAHPGIGPIALMHHQLYAHAGNKIEAPYHDLFKAIKYPIVKATGRAKAENVDWDHPYFYYFDWSHDVGNIWEQTKETDVLYYVAEGCSLHAALQVCWIMGARNVFTIGCDSRTMGGQHYASFDKNNFRADEVLKRGATRNYDAYVWGSLIIGEFLKRKGINLVSLSTLVGYHLIDEQFDVQSGKVSMEEIIERARNLRVPT